MNLVIVESPTKAKTIGVFLGKDYKVVSSFGHVRDLPKSRLGIDVENKFEPHYIVPIKMRKTVKELKKIAEKAGVIVLATDGDREGEAIAWHLREALKDYGEKKKTKTTAIKAKKRKAEKEPKKFERIIFHEITKKAISEAVQHPREINLQLVHAQQTRRILDRLVGYGLSPFLWKKIFRGLSAGRVQSVALRIIAEREEERKKFVPDEYWTIEAILKEKKEEAAEFTAFLRSKNGEALEQLAIKNKEEAEKIKTDLLAAFYRAESVERKETGRNPLPPFTTSALQQEASRRLRFSARQTMRIAQNLYENGFITYMRTDSVNLSEDSLTAAEKWIGTNVGKVYVITGGRRFKKKSKLAQEAHEAIRPTSPENAPPAFGGNLKMEKNEARLYDLVWRRFIASQMPPSVFDATTIDVLAEGNGTAYGLRANGAILKFDGFLKVWPSKISENELPTLAEGADLEPIEIKSEEHKTEPPPRYNEASLIKFLEKHGIGRPSTYAPIISVIQDRNYVEKDEARRFAPTETGNMVNKMLTENFPEVVDIGFTAEMENHLDAVALGKKDWREVLGNFYGPFKKNLDKKYEEVKAIEKKEEETDEVCDKCGKPMVIKRGRFGKFIACSDFPDCKNTKKLITAENSFGPCPKCAEGLVIARKTKTHRTFYGCSRYPECDHASWTKPGSGQNIDITL